MRTTVCGESASSIRWLGPEEGESKWEECWVVPRRVVFYQKGTEEPWGGPTSSKSQASIGFVIQKDLI